MPLTVYDLKPGMLYCKTGTFDEKLHKKPIVDLAFSPSVNSEEKFQRYKRNMYEENLRPDQVFMFIRAYFDEKFQYPYSDDQSQKYFFMEILVGDIYAWFPVYHSDLNRIFREVREEDYAE